VLLRFLFVIAGDCVPHNQQGREGEKKLSQIIHFSFSSCGGA
jgi:hypothetical protein